MMITKICVTSGNTLFLKTTFGDGSYVVAKLSSSFSSIKEAVIYASHLSSFSSFPLSFEDCAAGYFPAGVLGM